MRKRPAYFGDYVTEASDDQVQMTIDYCYRLVSNVPLTFSEAVTSPHSREWSSAVVLNPWGGADTLPGGRV